MRAGEAYFAPRDIPQRLRNLGAVPARCALIGTPGGFDEFIAKVGMPPGMAPPGPPTPEQMAGLMALAQAHGVLILEAPEV